MLLQQVCNGRVGCVLLAQFRDGVMDRLQVGERDAMRIRPEFLNRFAQ